MLKEKYLLFLFTTINRRINRLDIKIKDTTDNSTKSKDEYIVIAIDSNGIKITNRGQWIRDKLHIKNKKGYLKIHVVAVNVKTKKILSMTLTDEHVHDSKSLPELIDEIMESDKMIGKLFADGSYNSDIIFRYLGDNGIQSCIKVRKNSKVRWRKGHILRNLSVLDQRNDLQKWKEDSVNYGQRWIVEIVFSCLKRRFVGEYIYSVKLKNMIQEMMSKASLYNKMISV